MNDHNKTRHAPGTRPARPPAPGPAEPTGPELRALVRVITQGDRENWIDPDDARQIARDLWAEGYRLTEGTK